jgi:autotransporter-associated beta strand protein
MTPAVHTWTGGAWNDPLGNLWSRPSNWIGGSPAGDSAADLVFPTANHHANVNDLVGLHVNSIEFTDLGYSLSGNPITLGSSITDNSALTNTINFQLALPSGGWLPHILSVTGGGVLKMEGALTGPGGIEELGGGTLTLGGFNTYAGLTYIGGGTLQPDFNNVIPDGSDVTVAAGATFDLAGHKETIGSLWGGGVVLLGNVGELNIGFNNTDSTFSGDVNGGDMSELVKEGNRTLTLKGHNLYPFTAIEDAGTLLVGAASAMPAGGGVWVDSNATFDVHSLVVHIGGLDGTGKVTLGSGALHTQDSGNGDTHEFAGVISGTGGLYKEGGGTLTLSGANTYTGGTHVKAGTLLVTGSLAPSSKVTVGGFGSSATLGGTGTVGNVTAAVLGNIDPGVSGTGTLKTGNVVFNAGSSFTYEIGAQLSATGTVNLSGNPTLNVPVVNLPFVVIPFTIIQSTGGIQGTFKGLPNNTVFAYGWGLMQVIYTANSVELIWIP